MLADGHERGESAVRAAGYPDSLRIAVAGVERKLDGGHVILQVATTEILIVCVLKFHAVTGRAARIGSNHDIAARGQCSNRATETVLCLSRGPSMRIHDHRR